MGIGELIGMRWVLWEDPEQPGAGPREIPPQVFEEMMGFIERALAPEGAQAGNVKEKK